MPIVAKRDALPEQCAKLDAAHTALAKFKKENHRILTQLRELEDNVGVQETAVRSLLHAKFAGKSSGVYEVYNGKNVLVTVTPKMKRTIDIEALLVVKPDAWEAGLLQASVDMGRFDALLEEGAFPETDSFLTRTPMTPGVSFGKPKTMDTLIANSSVGKALAKTKKGSK